MTSPRRSGPESCEPHDRTRGGPPGGGAKGSRRRFPPPRDRMGGLTAALVLVAALAGAASPSSIRAIGDEPAAPPRDGRAEGSPDAKSPSATGARALDCAPPAQLPSITAPAAVCVTSSLESALCSDEGGAATYSWTVTNGSVVSGQGTRSLVFDPGPAGSVQLDVVVDTGIPGVCPAPATATVRIDPELAPEPPGLATVTQLCGGLDLTWPAGDDAVAWEVRRGLDSYSCQTGTLVATTTEPHYVDTNVTARARYTYEIRAVNACGRVSTGSCNYGYYNEPPDATWPNTESACRSVRLRWWRPAGNWSYEVHRAEGWSTCDQIVVGTTTEGEFVDTGLAPGTAYSYGLIVISPCGSRSTWLDCEFAVTATTAAVPAVPEVYSVDCDTVEFRYYPVGGATGYELLRATGSDCASGAVVGSFRPGFFFDEGLTPGTLYSYRVRTTNDCDAPPTTSACRFVETSPTPPPVPGIPHESYSGSSCNKLGVSWSFSRLGAAGGGPPGGRRQLRRRDRHRTELEWSVFRRPGRAGHDLLLPARGCRRLRRGLGRRLQPAPDPTVPASSSVAPDTRRRVRFGPALLELELPEPPRTRSAGRWASPAPGPRRSARQPGRASPTKGFSPGRPTRTRSGPSTRVGPFRRRRAAVPSRPERPPGLRAFRPSSPAATDSS